MLICGIDPGTRLGYAVYEPGRSRIVDVGLLSLRPRRTDASAVVSVAKAIDKFASELIERFAGLACFAVETTDWHQNLLYAANWRTAYARERAAQRNLNRILGIFAHLAVVKGIALVEVPVSRWHSVVGARGKSGVAFNLFGLFQDQLEWSDGRVFWKTGGRLLGEHEVDSIGIAYYAANRGDR